MKKMRGLVRLRVIFCSTSCLTTSRVPQMFGGAALNEDVGNSLASKGIALYDCYGWCGVAVVSEHLDPDNLIRRFHM